MLQPGGRVPFFDVTTLDDRRVTYRALWQRQTLLLVRVPDRSPESMGYVSRLAARMADLAAHDTAVVITSDAIDGVPGAGAVVADRWGEIHYAALGADAAGMSEPDALIEWLRYVQYQCPECEGEAR